MLRRLIACLASALPPKFVSDRLLPWASLVLAVIGALWVFHEYSNDLAIARVMTTIDLHKRYTEKLFVIKEEVTLASIPLLLHSRCKFIENSVKSGKLKPRGKSINCNNIDRETLQELDRYILEGELRKQLREYVFSRVAERTLSKKEAQGLAHLSIFFRSIVICVEHDNCDAETSIALFAREMVEFVNMTCPFDAKVERGGKTVTKELAKFLVDHEVHKNIYWSLDPNREKLFACDQLRALEG